MLAPLSLNNDLYINYSNSSNETDFLSITELIRLKTLCHISLHEFKGGVHIKEASVHSW